MRGWVYILRAEADSLSEVGDSLVETPLLLVNPPTIVVSGAVVTVQSDSFRKILSRFVAVGVHKGTPPEKVCVRMRRIEPDGL